MNGWSKNPEAAVAALVNAELTDDQLDFNLEFFRQVVSENSVVGPKIWQRTIDALEARTRRQVAKTVADFCGEGYWSTSNMQRRTAYRIVGAFARGIEVTNE